ncbi:hypothetical protein IIA79_07620 [bacterium]|nr:hypothetical protein [bacterium]
MYEIIEAAGVRGRSRTTEQDSQRFWFDDDGLDSELRFHHKLSYVEGAISSAYDSGDLKRIEDCFRRLFWIHPWVESEPILSHYETFIVLAALRLGQFFADRFVFNGAYRICESSRKLLLAKHKRRLEEGLPPRPDSECWYRLYTVLSELKWKGERSARDRMMAPERIIGDYLTVEEQLLHNLKLHPSKAPTRDNRMKEALGWCGLSVIKMTMRWCIELATGLIEHFNQVHGPILNKRIGHFQIFKPDEHPSPWYWDFELYKWCMIGYGTEDEALLCHQWRLESRRAEGFSEESLKAFKTATDYELQFLLSRKSEYEALRARAK